MRSSIRFLTTLVLLTCLAVTAGSQDNNDVVVTLIFTNDMESAYDPVPAWWIDGMDRIGGIAELTTLIREIRRDEPNVFLFDSGDIFTGHYAAYHAIDGIVARDIT